MHAFSLHKTIVDLNRAVRSHLVIVDALTAGEAVVYGAVKPLHLVVGGRNVFEVDAYCCALLDTPATHPRHMALGLRWMAEAKVSCPAARGEQMATVRGGRRRRDLLRKAAYRLLYLLDLICPRSREEQSILPLVHFYTGIRPAIDGSLCDGCGQCQSACIVDAVDLRRRQIRAEQCSRLRCLRCVEVCPRGAIRLKGLRAAEAVLNDGGAT